jgi:colanic acid biosynthesis protein WcaH
MVNEKQFLEIINSTPLVSIDFILENPQRKILLGKRVNRPAQSYWFVPGGRITKNEKIADAIKRISSTELGTTISISDMQLLGAFDHIYNDNYFGKDGINTHYVVLAYMAKVKNDFRIVTDGQHSEIKWWSKGKLLEAPDVHQNTKAYFINA